MEKAVPIAAAVFFVASLLLGRAAEKRRNVPGRTLWHRSSYAPGGWRLWLASTISMSLFLVLGLCIWLPVLLKP